MAEKRYNSDWAKAKSRELVKDVISRTLLSFRRPEDLRVLCFPGIDAEEIFKIYDSLGIPRGNIVGIEREAEIAEKIEQQNLGIKLIRGTLEDYIKEQVSVAFDVVSLDYIGPLSSSQVSSLQQLTAKQQKNHFVLHTANLLRRDQKAMPWYYYGYAMSSPKKIVPEFNPLTQLDSIEANTKEWIDRFDEGKSFSEEKKAGYSTIIQASYSGMNLESCNELLQFVCGREYLDLLRVCERRLSEGLGREVHIDPKKPFHTLKGSKFYPYLQNVLEQIIWIALKEECKAKQIVNEEMQFAIWIMLAEASKPGKFFRARDGACYSYLSESGAPMLGDIYFLSYPERSKEACSNLARALGYPAEFKVVDGDMRKIYGCIADYLRIQKKFGTAEEIKTFHERVENRIFLGNSSRPVLTKQRAIEEFKGGVTVGDVKEKYRGWVNKPLVQWKAHVTMGTYDPMESVADENGDKITKEEALELLSAEIPPEEIFQAYPTSFSVGQLRAYKAHLTQGTYKSDSTSNLPI